MVKFSSRFLITLSIAVATLFITGAYVFAAYNVEKAKQLKFPIGELGGCGSFEECKVYCNKDENIPKCNRFSIKNGLLTPEEVADTERMLSLMEESGLPGKCRGMVECFSYCESAAHTEECWDYAQRHNLVGPGYDVATVQRLAKYARDGGKFPGDCKTHTECEAYCEDTAHLNECLEFAVKLNFLPPDKLAEAKKVAAALQSGANLPGGCRSKNECMAYCEDSSHMRECVAFAEKAGFISSAEAEEAKKIIPLLERGEKTPGNCARKEACEAYCMEPAHIDECLAFAEKAGILPPEELAEAKRMVSFIKNGETPGRCKGKDECETYCQDASHFEECVAFGEKAGLLSKEEAELAKKFKGTGPGGCRSREDCEEFCKDPANQETCLNFAKEHGLLEEFSGVEAETRAKAEAEGRAKAEAEIRACAEKPCGEMIACLQSVQASAGGDGGHEGEGGVSGEAGLPIDVQEKLNACIAEITAEKLKEAGAGGVEHPTGIPPQAPPAPQSEDASKEYQKQYEEEYQKQYQEQVKSQVDCSLFEAAPTCEYAGSPGSQNYNLCKQCFPNK